MNSVIKLFKAVPVTTKDKGKADKDILKETVKRGFIFAPEIFSNYHKNDLINLIEDVSKEIGISSEKANNAFHKSWKKIAEADIEQLVMEQIIHYITTYGYEAMGIYSNDSIYIPLETLKLPKINLDKISLIVIKGYTKVELKEKLINLLGSGIALKEDTKKDVIDVATFVELTEEEIFNINNKEVRCALCDLLDTFPKDPIEFLRFMIYKATNKTLLIKDRFTISEIKSKDNLSALGLLGKYQNKYGLDKLAEIFYRFKPLFLAFRTNKKLKQIINKIRRLAEKYHKPMPEDFLNSITAHISKGEYKTDLSDIRLMQELSLVNVFRKIRLAYALKFRTADVDSILYRIRNGKSYATDFKFENKQEAQRILDIVLDSIVCDIKSNVEDKKIYIPKNLQYALPTTEKMFTGDFPSGSYVTVPKDIIVGVHWDDVGSKRIDLDLSLINCEVGKIGWDSSYRTEGRDVLFSGDLTAAPKPNGASELFYIQRQKDSSYILMVNYFNYNDYDYEGDGKCVDVPFKILVASEKITRFNHNHMVNPNNIIATVKSVIKERQKMLGLLVVTPEENRFYFCESSLGSSITSYGNDYTDKARKYLLDFYKNTISLNDILEKAGAKLVDDNKKCDIDLSYETLEKDSIIKLLTK